MGGSKSHFFRQQEDGLTLVAWYKFENNINDSAGSNNGISSTNLTYVLDADGFAGSFNSFTSNVIIPDNADFSFTDGITDLPFKMSLTWKCTRLSGTQLILNKRDNLSTSSEWQIAVVGNTFRTDVLSFNGSGFLTATITDLLVLNKYYDIEVNYDGSGLHTGLKITVNGVESTTSFVTGTYNGMSNTNSVVMIGDAGWSPSSGLGVGGLIDNVKIYK